MRYTMVLLILVIMAGFERTTHAQVSRWSELEHARLLVFDWNCASPAAFPAAPLKPIVKRVMKREDFEGFGSYGDRAVAFDLNGDQKPEYFVPLDCGAVGNCAWGVFALNPARELGLIYAESFYVHRSAGRWPDLATYTHLSAMEGSVMTYRLRKQRYRESGPWYAINHTETALDIQGGMGHKLPKFLAKAKPGCKEVGN
jgi:hypothetical protein